VILTGKSKGSPDSSPSEPDRLEKKPTAGPRSHEGGSGSEFYIFNKDVFMLMLGRYAGQSIIMTVGGEKITVTFVEMTGKQAKIGIDASREVKIERKEIHDAINETGINAEAIPVFRTADPVLSGT
jgi:carbon storage regulator CsrA